LLPFRPYTTPIELASAREEESKQTSETQVTTRKTERKSRRESAAGAGGMVLNKPENPIQRINDWSNEEVVKEAAAAEEEEAMLGNQNTIYMRI